MIRLDCGPHLKQFDSLDELAVKTGCAASHLSRTFAEEKSVPPSWPAP
ncbi:MAG: hypothetical protein IPK22_20905 [Verrucomicrobiaceae bacterium]|nr:hypothetical protein [Verrucomicrobiaceae bacterium]